MENVLNCNDRKKRDFFSTPLFRIRVHVDVKMTDLVSALWTLWVPSTFLYIRSMVQCIPVLFLLGCAAVQHYRS